MVLDHLGRMPEVGQPGDAPGGVAILSRAIDGEADWVGGVVGDGDRGDSEPAELERAPRLEDLPVRSHLERPLDAVRGLPVGEDLEVRVLSQQRRESDAMVAVLMGDHNRIEGAGFRPQLAERGFESWAGKARIQHHACAARFQNRAVAGTAGAKDVEGEGHRNGHATPLRLGLQAVSGLFA